MSQGGFMNKNNEYNYGSIMRFCKNLTRRELEKGNTYDYIQNMLVKAVEIGCAKGLAKFLIEADTEAYEERIKKDLQTKSEFNSAFCKISEEILYAPKRENNRNEQHTYKKD